MTALLRIPRLGHVRRYTRYPVRWPMFYGNDDFAASGTILDVTHEGWKLVGRKRVTPGMSLHIRAFPPGKESPLWIKAATVRWVNGAVFAVDVHDAPPKDVAWLSEYLHEVFSLWLLTPGPSGERRVGQITC